MEDEKMEASIEAYQYVLDNMEGSMPSPKEFKAQFDEVMLRWYICGSIEERDPCDLYERWTTRNLYRDKFPAVFVKALIFHLTECEICREGYLNDYSVSEVPTPQDA